MTSSAHDAPLVFPAVVFRPIRLLVISLGLTLAAILAAAWLGRVMVGVFIGIGLLMGLLNALLVQRSVAVITAEAHPLKTRMAMNSAWRLMVFTVIALIIAFIFQPAGLGVVFGLAVFQVLLVASTTLPVWKKLRAGGGSVSSGQTGSGDEHVDRRGDADD